MAYLHYVKGDYRSAAEHLKKSFDLDRDNPEARLYDGLLHFQQRDYDGGTDEEERHCMLQTAENT
jgi:hypothetical protein